MTAWSKAWVCGHSLVGIVGSDSAEDMDICLYLVGAECCQVQVCAKARSLVQRCPTEFVCLSVIKCNNNNNNLYAYNKQVDRRQH